MFTSKHLAKVIIMRVFLHFMVVSCDFSCRMKEAACKTIESISHQYFDTFCNLNFAMQ